MEEKLYTKSDVQKAFEAYNSTDIAAEIIFEEWFMKNILKMTHEEIIELEK